MRIFLAGAQYRRSDDGRIGRNRFGVLGRGYSTEVRQRAPQSLKKKPSRDDENQDSAIESYRIGEALFPSGRGFSFTFHSGAQLFASSGNYGGTNRGDRAANDRSDGRGQESPTATDSVAATAGRTTDGAPYAIQK